MQSTIDFPFNYLEYYLSKTIYEDLSNFYSQYENESFGNRIKKIDKKTHTIEIYKDQYSENELSFSVTTFETKVNQIIKREVQKTKQFIELGFKNNFNNKVQIDAFASFLKVKIKNITKLKAFNDFAFLKPIFDGFERLIELYSAKEKNLRYNFLYSFNLLPSDNEEQKIKIEKLYNLLIETPSMINSSKKGFFSAFTGKEVNDKIQWIAKSRKSKLTNRTSLLYLLDKLIEKKHLSSGISLDLYKFIRYVFVDENGNELKNLKNTRQNMSDNPDFKDRIENIVSSL